MKHFLTLLILSTLASCLGEDDYSVSTTRGLTFSVDTLKMDTLISGEATPTHTLMVYNPGKEAMRLSRVELEGGATSPFRVNVDGTPLEGAITDELEIGGRDSLRVFVMANVPRTEAIGATKVTDRLTFTTEGGWRGGTVLHAEAVNVNTVRGLTLRHDTTLRAGTIPLRILDSLVVEQGATLTIEAGVRLLFHAGAGITVRGRLITLGTPEANVVMRSDRLGEMFSGQPYDRIPGGWGGITIARGSFDNRLDGLDVHGGTFGIAIDSTDTNRTALTMTGSKIHCVTGHGISSRSARILVENTEVSNAGGDCVRIMGGDAAFTHTTIASFYPFAGRSGAALRYTNCDGDIRLPLSGATFTNCIITGWSDDEVFGTRSDRYPDDAFTYRFDHCLLNTPPISDDEAVTDCLWDSEVKETSREKNFTPPFDTERLLYLFLLSPQSQACGTARPETAHGTLSTDRLGRPRLNAEGKADMGCYRAETPQEEDTK